MVDVVGKAGLDADDLAGIRVLADLVNQHDGLALKLNWELMRARDPEQVNDYLAYGDGRLLGYAALDGFGGEYELTGMVHPEHRRKRIGQRLLNAAVAECRNRAVRQLLLVCERASASGSAFVAAQRDSMRYDFSEYRLELDAGEGTPSPYQGALNLRPATADDLTAIGTIRAASFVTPEDQARVEVAHAFTEQGSRLYLAALDHDAVGTIGVVFEDTGAYLRALAVPPALQGRGYGRAILSSAVALLLAEGQSHLSLDVATENRNALSLYLSCGFVETNCYDYYVVDLDSSLGEEPNALA